MWTLIALAVLAMTLVAILTSLREVTQDTIGAISVAATRARQRSGLHGRLAFAALWLLIFGLSYF
ncbi:hypothetical protein KUH32_09050 [Thalassococcus sp. CAU 1522]|uniref:Uncharacterized protein n=1 Tax=Thalassococcus arenae TaxID=2851652 RepID=A0ABS6N7C6_9RHOB|nr:hypothetical protein [Thalassococcus arenae]MBV2359920.1 hypothetical protein [Thalassococcus arenae]